MEYIIRTEQPADVSAIATVIKTAFEGHAYSEGLEWAIVESLRKNNQLSLSLVAVSKDKIVGHIAFSPIEINGEHRQWYGLGPLSVSPEHHGRGVGSALVREGLKRLQESNGKGCVVLGNPAYYCRFGFKANPGLMCDGAPTAHFAALSLCDEDLPVGAAEFHPSFWASNARGNDR